MDDRNVEMFDNLLAVDHIRITVIRTDAGLANVLLTILDNDIQITSEQRMRFFGLTKRQSDVVHFVEMGLTNAQIASMLNISTKTVVNHLTQIYEKTQTHNRMSLIRQLFV